MACRGGGGDGDSSGIGLTDLNQDGQIVVLCFGDSITAGVGDGPSPRSDPRPPSGYPGRLQQLLIPKARVPLVVVDDGRPSEQTPAGLRRLRRDLGLTPVDYAILLEGANDIQNGHASRALTNTQAMIDAVFQAGALPVVGTLTPACCAHARAIPQEALFVHNDQLRAMATNNSAPIIDFYAAFAGGPALPYDSSLGLIHVPEGLHPTPAGYDVMAATAAAAF